MSESKSNTPDTTKNNKYNKVIYKDIHTVIKEEYHAVKVLLQLSKRQKEVLTKSVEHLSYCKGKIVVTGVGKSNIVGRKICATLASTGSPSMFINAAEASHGDLGAIDSKDIIVMISNSGNTEECLRMIPYIKKMNLEIILLTSNTKSELAKVSRFVIDIKATKEADKIGAPTNSTTSTLVMGDAIAIALMRFKKFTKEEFLASHPGGNLGKS